MDRSTLPNEINLAQNAALSEIADLLDGQAENLAEHDFIVFTCEMAEGGVSGSLVGHAHCWPDSGNPAHLRMENFAREAALAQVRITVEILGVLHDTGGYAGAPPPVDLEAERRTGDVVRGLIRQGRVSAVHDISDGGLLVAVAEMVYRKGCSVGISDPETDEARPVSTKAR